MLEYLALLVIPLIILITASDNMEVLHLLIYQLQLHKRRYMNTDRHKDQKVVSFSAKCLSKESCNPDSLVITTVKGAICSRSVVQTT